MSDTLDSSLYSRQLYVLGKDAMEKITKSSVLLSGLDGLGTEIAKCLVLGGIKKLYIHDNIKVRNIDLTSGYYYSEKDIGNSRVKTIFSKLKELNPYVEIIPVENFYETYKNTELVIICNFENFKFEEIININQELHDLNKKFISCSTLGLFGQIFCDFNNNFIVNDVDGEDPKTGNIISIKLDSEKITIESASDHNLGTCDNIKIKSPHGTFITKVTKVVNSKKFMVIYDKFFEEFTKNNFVNETTFEQIKDTKVINFQSMKECLRDFEKVSSFDAYNFDHTYFCHKLFLEYQGLYELNELSEKQKELKDKFFKTSGGNFCPVQSVIGSIVAQEAMKAVTGKFTPITQWLYFDELNLINLDDLKDNDLNKSSRYIGQEMIFGKKLQDKLKEAKVFIVGSGAIGCEHLKNFGMMGLGNIVITDMDTIEKSNLNRQFLFRNTDIGNFKSVVASREIMKMNPEINVESHKNKVGQETEIIYNDKFFESLTCVANALDNVNARLFVDSLCLKYKKHLLESGTLSTKGNIQTIIPNLTESYGSQVDPPEKTIPFCTLKNFPYAIEHTIQYARDYFQGLYVNAPEKINSFNKNKNKFLDGLTLLELDEFYSDLKDTRENIPENFIDCIKYAIKLWYKLFNHQIQDLIKKYPENELGDGNIKFWSGTKTFPQFRDFNHENKDDLDFVISTSVLHAKKFNIIIDDFLKYFDGDKIKNIFHEMENLSYISKDINIAKNENEQKKLDEEKLQSIDRNSLNQKIHEIANDLSKELFVNEFEKDDDSNFHIDFVHTFSNLRAENYKIKTIERLDTKRIAGKIIPAIATTTSLVSGLVSIELVKILMGKNKIDDYKNYFVNLALPLFTFSEPGPVTINEIADGKFKFTIWDSFDFKNVYLSEIFDYFQKNYNIKLTMLNIGQKMLYSGFMNESKAESRKKMRISEIYYELFGENPNINLEIGVVGEQYNSDSEDEIDLPNIKINF